MSFSHLFERIERADILPNPCLASSRRQVKLWAERQRLGDQATLKRLDAYDCGLYAASVLPSAIPEIVDLCAGYFAWLIAVDDAVGECQTAEEAERLRRFIRAHDASLVDDGSGLPHAETALQPYIATIVSLRDRGASIAERVFDGRSAARVAWAASFHASINGYLAGCAMEAPYRIHREVPSPDAYRAFRQRTIGMRPILDIAGLALDGAPLGGKNVGGEAGRGAIIELCALANDLISYRACETERDEEDRLNIVTVVARDRGISVAEAAGTLAQRYNDLREETIARVIRRWPTPHFRAALDAIDGNLAWYLHSVRYRGKEA